MTSKLLMWLAVCAVMVVPALGLAQHPTPFNDGDVAPDFTVQMLNDEGEGGDMVSLSDYAGKIVVMDLFATWCGPCHASAEGMEANVWQVYKDRGVVVWGIDTDSRESFAKLQGFKDQHSLTYHLALDVNSETRPYSSGYIPTLYIVDREGIVRYARVGAVEHEIIAKIEELLAQEPTDPTFELRLNKMDLTPYTTGDIMNLYADVTNPGDALAVNIFIAVELFGEFYFWPTYGELMAPTPFTLPDQMVMLGYVLESVVFNDTFPHGTFTWYGVLANPIDGEWITEPSVVSWTFGAELP